MARARLTPAAGRSRRRNTDLAAAGAEFLVLGSLLAEDISAWKAYTNFPGFDIVAGDIARGSICRIQVKSRSIIGATEFPIKNFGCDFVCFVRLNSYGRGARVADRRPPEIFVLPVQVARRAWIKSATFSNVRMAKIKNPEQYLVAWDLVADFLAAKRRRR